MKKYLSLAIVFLVALSGYIANTQPASAAITLDSVGTSTGTTATLNVNNLTISAGATLLTVQVSSQDSNHGNLPVTGMTWNGVNLSIGTSSQDTGDTHSEIWYLFNPASGNKTLAVTTVGAVWKGIIASSWKGTQSSGSVDAKANSSGSGSGSSVSITTVADNALIIDSISNQAVVSSYGSGQTAVTTSIQGQSFENESASYKILASHGATTMTESLGFGATWAQAAVSFAPAAAATTANFGYYQEYIW